MINRIKSAFQNGQSVDLSSEDVDINAIAGVLKTYFRELRDPLIPFAMYHDFIAAMSCVFFRISF